MTISVNVNKLQKIMHAPFVVPTHIELRRHEAVFFVGGNLPVFETLETMYESYCLEATDLLHVTFGDYRDFAHNLYLVRQIKKNFPVRLMGRIGYEITPDIAEQLYLAGLDMVTLTVHSGITPAGTNAAIQSIGEIFPRWSLTASIFVDGSVAHINRLINVSTEAGIVALPEFSGWPSGQHPDAAEAVYNYAITVWQYHHVQLKPLEPLLRLMTPLEFAGSKGIFRTVVNKIQDRRLLAVSDLRRHLRTKEAEASFESAGL